MNEENHQGIQMTTRPEQELQVLTETNTESPGLQDVPIQGSGWIFFTIGWASILILIVFCFSRLFKTRKKRSEVRETDTEV
ncbi:MAG: hypothetical protein JRH15_02035 [Deltaproteobacteria bacterium]|nr:hypothetical protein [Deltaproteobacteria bacterium]